jgi:hypothetical protein
MSIPRDPVPANTDAWFQEDRMEILIVMLVLGLIPMVAAILSDRPQSDQSRSATFSGTDQAS